MSTTLILADASASHRRTPVWKRQLMILARWLHIYLSMASFAIIFFFAVTGLALNHQDWFTGQQKTIQARGSLDRKFVTPKVAEADVIAYLRRVHGIRGAVNDFRIEDNDCSIAFKGPGYAADVLIDRATGSYEVTETRVGWVAILNDLHKGRDTGKAWSRLIDLSAVLMTLVSITGLALIFFLHKKRVTGLLALGAGAVLCYLAYVVWVP